MPIRRRPRKQAKPDPTVTTGKGLIPDSGSTASQGSEKQTAIYLSPDHGHLAVVTNRGRFTLYRLNGEQIEERLGEYPVNRDPKMAWSSSG